MVMLHEMYLRGVQQQRSCKGVHGRIAPTLHEEAPLPVCTVTISCSEMRTILLE